MAPFMKAYRTDPKNLYIYCRSQQAPRLQEQRWIDSPTSAVPASVIFDTRHYHTWTILPD